jgi:hydroxymethylpyrimidine/phosphomethylpyrimidine kinase
MKIGLTLAGSDSGGGAGIQADIKAMQANGVFATSVITAITAQNTVAVTAAYVLPLALIEAQIDAVLSDIRVDAAKTGMLASAQVIETVAQKVEQWRLSPLVVDPVMVSKSGYALLDPQAIETLKTRLLPLATLVTPNAHEARLLAQIPIKTLDDAHEAARRIHALGPQAVLVKGGHIEAQGQAVDVLFDGTGFQTYSEPYIDTPHTHGTGCTYSAAITANLAQGCSLHEAIQRAKHYLTQAIRYGFALGAGHGPTHHFYFLTEEPGRPSQL